jgi:hypothetical protein
MRIVPLLLMFMLLWEGVAEVKVTDAYIKMGSVHATLEADAANTADETAEVAVKAYFYEGAPEENQLYIADNSEKVTLKPGGTTEAVVAVLYPHGEFTLDKVELYLNGRFDRVVEYGDASEE